MTDKNFVKLLEDLQKKVEYIEEQKFSKVVINEFRNPSNFGILDDFNAVGEIKGPCGDTMKITLKIRNKKIIDARFWTDGCGATIACGSMLTKMIIDMSLKEAYNISDHDLTNALNGLPDGHLHCSMLAVNTLQMVIENYIEKINR